MAATPEVADAALFGGVPLRPSALLCDMDGTLIDSEPLWSAAARHLAESHRAPWTAEDDHRIVGWSVPAVADLLIDRGVPLDDATIIESLHDGVTPSRS
ncbi:MAG: hypothetical protein HGA44_11010, partial [Cellulomonadaceae bacterium]|nr:hypothetical protein [Cellulomonadaceae bacterium]